MVTENFWRSNTYRSHVADKHTQSKSHSSILPSWDMAVVYPVKCEKKCDNWMIKTSMLFGCCTNSQYKFEKWYYCSASH